MHRVSVNLSQSKMCLKLHATFLCHQIIIRIRYVCLQAVINNIRPGELAMQAMTRWDCLLQEPGVWDVFVVKYVEVLDRRGELERCEELLRSYRELSLLPANALRMLCWFYDSRGWQDQNQTVETLTEICSLDNSDPLVLRLCQLCPSDQRIPLLFDYLDHDIRQSDLKAWKLLLKEIRPPCTNQAEVDKCWEIRSDWWPPYHFSDLSLPDIIPESFDDVNLIATKASVACCLMGLKNRFSKTAFKLFCDVSHPSHSVKKFLKLFTK